MAEGEGMSEGLVGSDVKALAGDPIITEAKKRYQRCVEWEGTARQRFVEDLKFSHGDSDNGYQWPNAIRRARDIASKPCLTMNMVRQHNLQIVNEAKRNKSSVKVVGTGNGSTQESANVFQALVRHTEYISNAQTAYSTAREFQVDAGVGWWRIVTEYESNDSFQQEAYIRRVWDPLSVYMDPDCQEKDCSDAKYGFIFDSMSLDDFEEAFPKYKGLASSAPLGAGMSDTQWGGKEDVMVVEYFRKVSTPDVLISFVDPMSGQRKEIKKSLLPGNARKAVLDHKDTKTRDIVDDKVEWKLIIGDKVIDETIWPGKYIPLVRVIGTENVIDGMMDRKGHTRSMKDAQRMFNYNSSAQVEFVALQGKTPWIAAAKAIEEFENMWNTANNANYSVLPWNHIDDEGNPMPPPQRPPAPTSSPAYQEGMATARDQMMEVSGQFQAQMGMAGNERTGRAIESRKEQSATSVYHFQDNYADALRLTGKMLIDLYPKIYDTRRVLKVLADDGTDLDLEIDPSAKQAFMQQMNHQGEVIRRVFNPNVGKYDVASDVGPAYGSKRQETVDALTLILTQAPALTGIIGDLLLDAMDFDKAQEAARRLKRMIPPQALGQGPTQQEQQSMAQINQLKGLLAKALQDAGKDKLKLVGKDQMRDIDSYEAETKRMAALQKLLPMDPDGLKEMIHQLVEESMKTTLSPIIAQNQEGVQDQSGMEAAPVPGARKAPDGEWYVLDPTRKGKYLRLGPLAQQRQGGQLGG